MDVQEQYRSMCQTLSPLARPFMSPRQWEGTDACFRAGEIYEAMLDLLWAAIEGGAPYDPVMECFALVQDEDKDQYRQILKEHSYAT